jgi:hypothetical protein
MLHLNTAATVAASVLTGAALVTVGTLLPHKVVSDPLTVEAAWASCVETTYNMGGGTDSDLARCDRLYPVGPTVVADCLWNAGEGGQDWPADVTARCGWKRG